MFVIMVGFVESVRGLEVVMSVIMVGFVVSVRSLEVVWFVNTAVCVEVSMAVFSMDVEVVPLQ